jgi:hypothetical protein
MGSQLPWETEKKIPHRVFQPISWTDAVNRDVLNEARLGVYLDSELDCTTREI